MWRRLAEPARKKLDATVDRRIARRLADGDVASAARFMPVDPAATILVTPRAEVVVDPTSPEDFALPPDDLRELAPDYLELGAAHVDTMRSAVARAGCAELGNVLEFGCATGRLTRWFLDQTGDHEVWGVDINAAHIAWNQAHLAPPFRFAVCTGLPALPFEDDFFGFVYAGSVFTHISEMEEPWLLELRRLTRPGGYLYLTVMDNQCVASQLTRQPNWFTDMVKENESLLSRLGTDCERISIGRGTKDAMVFHDRDALVRRWSAHLEVVDVIDQAFYTQTAIVLRKRPR
jgi:SAM-dependent methyltransferase